MTGRRSNREKSIDESCLAAGWSLLVRLVRPRRWVRVLAKRVSSVLYTNRTKAQCHG